MRIGKEKSVCVICKKVNNVRIVYSSSGFGSCDLDYRPPFMARYTVSYEINRCNKCGYCSTDLSKKIKNTKRIISSTKYKKQLDMKGMPPKSNAYCCLALICKENGKIVNAGWNYMKAAWICDDKNKIKFSIICREFAFSEFMGAIQKNIKILSTRGEEKVLLADIKRRMSEYEIVDEICTKALKYRLNKNIKKILKYQQYLSIEKNNNVYTMDAALKFHK